MRIDSPIRFSSVLFIATLSFLAIPAPAEAVPVPVRKIYSAQLEPLRYADQMKTIHSQGLDIAGVDFDQKEVDLVLTVQELQRIRKKLPRVIFTENPETVGIASVDPSYQTPEKIEALVKDYAKTFSELAEAVEVGKSALGRTIWAMRITSKLIPSSEKPRIFFNGMHHAREVMSAEVPIDIIEQLLKGYATDLKIKNWVDRNEIWILPMLNVDGNHIVWTKQNMWRKNGKGVDINRNYPYQWGKCNGSSGITWQDNYRGPSAGSEPETQVMMNLVAKIKPVFNISFHSYSEMVLYPEGCKDQRVLTKEVVEKIGKEMAALIPSDNGGKNYKPGTPWEILYAVDGDDIDWMYHEFGVIPYVIELNAKSAGFQPPYKLRDPTVKKLRPAWGMLLDRLEGSGIRGKIADSKSSQFLSNAKIIIERPGGFPQIEKVNSDGGFHIILNPGTYQVEFRADGYESRKQTVEVKDQRTPLAIQLVKAGQS